MAKDLWRLFIQRGAVARPATTTAIFLDAAMIVRGTKPPVEFKLVYRTLI